MLPLLRSKLFYVVLGLVVTAGGFCYWQWDAVRANPVVSAVVTVVGIVAAAAGPFFKKVWGHLEPDWAEKLAKWIKLQVELLLSGFRRRYYTRLLHRHRVFNVRGLRTQGTFTLELDRVFVELRIAWRNPQETGSDPLRGETRQGNRGVWELLGDDKHAYRCLAVLGPPGSGKTTLLQHVVLTLVQNKQRRFHSRCPAYVPIFLFLRDHAKALVGDNPPSLADLAAQNEERDKLPPPPGWFARQLDGHRCLVLLDGLDEVGDAEQRKKVAAWVSEQVKQHGGNRFVVTSRVHGYQSNPLPQATLAEVQPFGLEQIGRFVHGWYLANEVLSFGRDDAGVRADAERRAGDLLRRLHATPALAALAVNPLLLTMIATVHRYRAALPGRRVELYKEICDVFLVHWQEAKGLTSKLDSAQLRSVLQPLAYYMMKQRKRELPLAEAVKVIQAPLEHVNLTGPNAGPEFLKEVEKGSGLLLEREPGVYGFAHLTFQEYLAACHLCELKSRTAKALVKETVDPWWRETLRLYVAQGDATPILQTLLAGDNPGVAELTLAYECLAEARTVEPAWRERLHKQIFEGLESTDRDRARLAAEVLLALRLNSLVRIGDKVEIDPRYLSRAEYQLFLDDQIQAGEPCQPDHWPNPRFTFEPGSALEPVTGVRHSDAVRFCDWLTERAKQHGELELRYRLPTVAEASSNPATVAGVENPLQIVQRLDVGCWCEAELPAVIGGTPVELEARWNTELDDATANLAHYDRDVRNDVPDEHVLDLLRARWAVHPVKHSLRLDRIVNPSLFHPERERLYEILQSLGLDSDQLRTILAAGTATQDPLLGLDFLLAACERLLEALFGALRKEQTHLLVLARGLDYAMRQCLATALRRLALNDAARQDRLWNLRYITIGCAALFDVLAERYAPERRNAGWRSLARLVRRPPQSRGEFQQLRDAYLDTCLRLSLLRERSAGKLPAWEGIRIVREHISP